MLDVLARRKTGGHMMGVVEVNRAPQDDKFKVGNGCPLSECAGRKGNIEKKGEM